MIQIRLETTSHVSRISTTEKARNIGSILNPNEWYKITLAEGAVVSPIMSGVTWWKVQPI